MTKLLLSPEQNGYNADDSSAPIRIALEGGPSALYADLIGASALVSVTWVLDPAEYEELIAFYRNEINYGSLQFQMDLVLDGPFPEEYDVQIVPNTFQLASQEGLTYTVVAQLEAQQKDIPVAVDEYIVAMYPDGESFHSILARLVNVTMPGSMG